MFISSFAFLSFFNNGITSGKKCEARDDIKGLCRLLAQSISRDREPVSGESLHQFTKRA